MLRGRRALVSGASQGIGKSIALTLARRGANVAVNYKSAAEQAEAEKVAELCRTFAAPSGGGSIAVRADVSRGTEVRAMFEQLDSWAATFPAKVASSGYVDGPTHKAPIGPAVDILVNNAGTQTWKRLLEIEEEEWDEVLGTNLKGCFLCTQQAALRMRDSGAGGSIVNIGSGCNHVPFPMLSSCECPTASRTMTHLCHGSLSCSAPVSVNSECRLLCCL
jgi:3-oxoacyl-[acyl-carrier protein] reductase